jgi:predicted transcriptional regulator
MNKQQTKEIIEIIKKIQNTKTSYVTVNLLINKLKTDYNLVYYEDINKRGGFFDYDYLVELLEKMQKINKNYQICVSLLNKKRLYFNFTSE